MRLFLLLLCALSTLLAGCQTSYGKRSQWPYPEPPGPAPQVYAPAPSGPEQTPSIIVPVEPQVAPLPEPRSLPAYPKTADEISGAAVSSLLKQARADREAGRVQQAQASLDRALRIEPRNYFVWSYMGQTYLAQQNYAQAVTAAQKSNSLARGNVYVELENYRVISAARDASGDSAGALTARARAEEIQQMLNQAQATP